MDVKLSAFSSFIQHFVFAVMKLIDFAIPDIPESLEITVKREQYLAKQALADTQTAKLVRVLLSYSLITKITKSLWFSCQIRPLGYLYSRLWI